MLLGSSVLLVELPALVLWLGALSGVSLEECYGNHE
jgi:hypothetical protein